MLRTIETFRNTTANYGATVKIIRDNEWQQYIVTIVGRPKDDYFTDDLHDARDTAKAMMDWAMEFRKRESQRKIKA